MLTVKQLEEMNRRTMDEIGRNNLVNIQEVPIDTTLPPEERMERYLKQVKNPYCFLCGDTAVHVRFETGAAELGDKLKGFFISLKKS